MASTLSIVGCTVTTTSVTIFFSDDVDQTVTRGGKASDTSALNPANYQLFDPSAGYPSLQQLNVLNAGLKLTAVSNTAVQFPNPLSPFNPGDTVLVQISNIALASDPGVPALVNDTASISGRVPGSGTAGTITKNVEDAVSYPILTEEIGYRPSPVGIPVGGGGGIGGGSGMPIGQAAQKAITDVLGWKMNTADPKGFIGALTQSFTLKEVEGHIESSWTPRTYAVQTDLGGGITGAQASLYMRAKDALDQSLSLLDGLYPLDPEADPEYVKALREMARSQMTEIVREFGAVGLPSILRIDTYFGILLGQNPSQLVSPTGQLIGQVQFDPDQIRGTLGSLRDTYGIYFTNNRFNNSVEDEQDITNFRVISDYMTSLMQSWIANRNFFIVAPDNVAFFGTQLVLISRQFNVIAETVNETRFALDSVFIGPSERQTLLLEFADPSLPPMFLEDVLDEVDKFVGEEGPRLLRDGGKISVTNNILPVVQALLNMIQQAHSPLNINELPDGFRTARVQNSIDDLDDQLMQLINLVEQVEQPMPEPDEKFQLSRIGNVHKNADGTWNFSIFGKEIDSMAGVFIESASPYQVPQAHVSFYSGQRIDVINIDPAATFAKGIHGGGPHNVTVTNPDGTSLQMVDALNYNVGTKVLSAGAAPSVVPVLEGSPMFAITAKPRVPRPGKKYASPQSRKIPVEFTMGNPYQAARPYRRPAAEVRVQAFDQQYTVLSAKVDSHSRQMNLVMEKLEELSAKLDAYGVEAPPRKR